MKGRKGDRNAWNNRENSNWHPKLAFIVKKDPEPQKEATHLLKSYQKDSMEMEGIRLIDETGIFLNMKSGWYRA